MSCTRLYLLTDVYTYVSVCFVSYHLEDHTQQNQANTGRRDVCRGWSGGGGTFLFPLLWKALAGLSSLKRTGCAWCFLGKGKGKNREDSSGLSSVAPHYFRGDFFFFFVQQSWALWCDWSSNRPGNANNPSSEDVLWRDCWDGTRKPARLATLKAEFEREMSGDWVKLSKRGLQSPLGSPDTQSDEMCLLLIAFSGVSCFFSRLVSLSYNLHKMNKLSCFTAAERSAPERGRGISFNLL